MPELNADTAHRYLSFCDHALVKYGWKPFRKPKKASNYVPPPRAPETLPARIGGLVKTLEAAPVGLRDDLGFWVANRFGEMVAAGEISKSEAHSLVVDASMRAGQTREEALRVARGLQ